MTKTTITKTVFFKASSETIWDFLTNKDKLGQWFHPASENLEKNKEFMLMGKDDNGAPVKICWGKVEHWNPHSQLEYTFTIKPLGGIMTHVKWTLEELGSGTRLTVEHSGCVRRRHGAR